MPLQLNLTEESDLTQYNLKHNATIPVPSYSSLNKPGVRASNLLCSSQQVRGNHPANNGEPFRFRIGSVKSAQLFQLSAENFFRLRYESVPLQ